MRSKPGFKGRRISLTLLFGTRCGEEKAHGTQSPPSDPTEAAKQAPKGTGHKTRRS